MKHLYLLLIILIDLSFVPSLAQNLPANFYRKTVGTATIQNPTVIAFSPDGRIFVAEQGGKLLVIKNDVILPSPFMVLDVDSNGERGLIGIALDPDFASNNYLYLYYTAKTPAIHNRISRFTANGDQVLAGSEVILLDLMNLTTATNHNGGAMAFGSDGFLYVAVGDNAQQNSGPQNKDSYRGKMLRLNKDGTAPPSNPFFNEAGATEVRKRVWSYGLRNPFTFSIHITGRIFVNEVGGNGIGKREEINDATLGGNNFGWPIGEGAINTVGYTDPVYNYASTTALSTPFGCAITGGAFFSPSTTTYPATYLQKYFFQDFCQGWIYYIDPTVGNPSVTVFATGLTGNTLSITTGLDGNLYYLDRDAKQLYRLEYTQNFSIVQQPSSVSINHGQGASFSVVASSTEVLTYQWQKNRVDIAGATQTTLLLNSVLVSDAGSYRVKVTNSSLSSIFSESATLTVAPLNATPVVTLLNPTKTPQMFYSAGDVIKLKATALDPEEGALPSSSFMWHIDFHHDTHTHDSPAVEGNEVEITIPNEGETSDNVWYRFTVMVTDSKGAVGIDSVDVFPNKVEISLSSRPIGLSLAIDGQPFSTDTLVTSVRGILRTISAPAQQTKLGTAYYFVSWSTGGTIGQTISPTASASYVAQYKRKQSIAFNAIEPKTYGDLPFFLNATSNVGLPVSYTSSDPSIALIEANKVTILKAGACTITASQSGDLETFPADNLEQLLQVNAATPTISWPNPTNIVYGTALSATQLNATSSVEGTFAYNPASGTKLNAGSNQNLSVTFTPTDGANYNAITKQVVINVSKATPTISWSNPADIIYGTALSATQLNATSSKEGTFAYTPARGTKLNAGNNQNLSVIFTSTDGANYESVTKQVTINVSKATPIISWSNPSDIVYGTALSSAQLNASSSADGTLAYTPASGTKINAGSSQNLSVTFNPTDGANYESATKQVAINVNKATPIISWNNPADIVFGTALSSTQLNATSTIDGTFAYNPASGTKLNAGSNQNLSVTFTATDGANYTSVIKQVTINVSKATPTISWSNPADIVYGTVLSPNQLNATSTVVGSFAYTPASGAKLNAGSNQNLLVTFTPTEGINYESVTKQVTINVSKATPTISWSNPSDIVYGTALSATQLNASSSLDGSFAYTLSSGTKLSAGNNQNLTVTFTPAETGNYNSATKLVSINVTKAQQQVTFPALADKTIGDGSFNLTGSANSLLPVNFTSTSDKISIANGQVTLLKAGRVSITASQAGNSDYNAAQSVTQSFCIKPAKPTITLSNLTTPTSLLTSSAADGNQWYVDGTAIAGATDATFSATKSGSYKVQVTIDDCMGEFSAEQPLVITGTEAGQASIDLYPNPVGDLLTIYFGDAAGTKQITVFALTGERLVTDNTESNSITIDVSNLSTGIYLTKILVDGAVQAKKFKKQ
jgi:glucose/arabinose dehydrogenase